ncbi:hypothetical protein KFL_000440090 [Klebsormidium nitens]|uniref:HNH nuclease domain-containing protein n=1 Tax=Klebsormidium nitens TaxID=105231 RepID=A0A1Y1HTZ2_KLENI|nr:hypothetical protein KFL_000440090 [Klebsormidium nitens]|eukprot:GAQ80007.1 hypothetical protein KFL_000440090 [Klebsormidium nitens]
MPRERFVALSDGRQLRLYQRQDGTWYYNDLGRTNLRSNQRTFYRQSAAGGGGGNGQPRQQAAPRGRASHASASQARRQGARVPTGRPATCPYNEDGPGHPRCRNYSAAGRLLRSSTAKKRFLEAAGYLYGQPAGTHVDHVIPLCLGGADCPCNMQLLTEAQHGVKTRADIAQCRAENVRL